MDIPKDVEAIFRDSRVYTVKVYRSGWVANSYKWPAPGQGTMFRRSINGIVATEFVYDRKRSHAKGPRIVGYSTKGGRLISG